MQFHRTHPLRSAHRLALCVFCGALAWPCAAQTPAAPPASTTSAATPPAAAASAAANATLLSPVIVTGNPLRSGVVATPVTVLTGDELVLRRGTSLGDTLGGQPGVSSTGFGPNADRPIIRGLDGDRVRIQSNGGASLDASSLSFDHAVPIDPLIVERIEVLRGPGALVYGGSALGGVVNALDNRIPTTPVRGVGGTAEVRLGGAQQERSGAAIVEAGNGRFAVHADAFGRRSNDLRVPNHIPIEDGTPLDPSDRVRNSAARASGGALGASMNFGTGHIGAAIDTYDSRYGIVVEPDVVIRMKRDHLAVSGEWRELAGPLRTVRGQINRTDYRHQEIEGTGEVGTTFDTAGTEARLELEHAAVGPLRGVVGLQIEDFDFSALGEEAFVPTTRTRRQGVFVLEEMPWSYGTLSAGLRLDRARVASDGDADPAAAQFGPASERRFSLRSASLANVWSFAPAWSLATTVAATERAPTSFELFANGVHAATAAYERGDTTLQPERGTNIDVAVHWQGDSSRWRAGVFSARFSRYISLEASGANVDVVADDGSIESFPEYVFRPVRARLNGLEIEGQQRLLERPWTLEGRFKLDMVRASNSDTGEPLPRVAPVRVTLGLDAAGGPWTLRGELQHAARQTRVPSTDVATEGHTLLNLAATYRFALAGTDAFWFLRVDNLTDVLAYSASSIRTVRDLSPLPGRALKTGLRMTF